MSTPATKTTPEPSAAEKTPQPGDAQTGTSSPSDAGAVEVPESEKEVDGSGNTSSIDPMAEDEEYVTGFPLIAIVAAVTMTTFLLLLDISILSTVRTFTPPSSDLLR
jgi:hypothetical protein